MIPAEPYVKQIVQNPRSGEVSLVDVPVPVAEAGTALVRNCFSLVSPGTEAQALQFGRMSALAKARSRPDLVAQVARKLRDDGPLATWRTVMGRLDALQPLGYSSAGVVEAVGDGVFGLRPGDRVACGGAGWANHAEFVVVPENLVARVPEGVPLDHAAFATLGAIALQGLRVAQPTLGEVAAVVGLGLVGQLALQCLRANGCRVLALDLDSERVKLAQKQGAEWAFRTGELPPTWAVEATDGHGVDLVLVAASATSAEPLELAATLCRHKGRISLVGNVPIEANRRVFYEKELELRMSTSYGPGRYDRTYEEHGLDYPIAYVRWTEQRNLQSFLQLLATGSVRPQGLDPEVVPFEEAQPVYADLASGRRKPLALLLRYDARAEIERVVPAGRPRPHTGARGVGVAFLGAGNYARGVLLPALDAVANVRKQMVVAASGASARRSAERFGFARCGTDPDLVLRDPDVDLVFIVTRHDSHAALACRALEAGKAVWLEKPAGLDARQVQELVETAEHTGGFLAIGYNRRFSPHTRRIREAFARRVGPLALRYSVAAGPPPAGTWIVDPREGGGRVIGEMCHFVDLCAYLVGQPLATVYARALGRDAGLDDSVVAMLGFLDGSTATIEYLAFASERLPKERFEASGDRRTATCDGFRTTRISGGRSFRTLRPDKGQAAALAEVVAALREGSPSPFRPDEIAAVSRATFAMLESIATGRVVSLAG